MSFASLVVLLTSQVIQGQVVDDQNQPVADCRVVIDTVGAVLEQVNHIDHYHYPDVGKGTLTDRNGKFKFADVESNRRFTVVAYKEGFDGKRSAVFEADKETPTVKLVRATDIAPDRFLRGAVIDEIGNPRPFAVIRVREQQNQGKRVYARNSIRLVVAADDGLFALPMPTNVDAASLSIETPGFVRTTTGILSIDAEPTLIMVTRGSSLAGRLVHQGKPVANLPLSIRVPGADGSSSLLYMKAATDSEGNFVFHHMPPNMPATIATTPYRKNALVLPMADVTLPENEMVADLGDLEAMKGHRIKLRLVSEEGEVAFEDPIVVVIQNGIRFRGGTTECKKPGLVDLGCHPAESMTLRIESERHEVLDVSPWLQATSLSRNGAYYRLLPGDDMTIEVVVKSRID